jgi:transcription antitermination factor NusG
MSRSAWYRRTRPQPEPPEPHARPDIERWYCVRTDYGAESTADIEIRMAGITLFAPTIWVPARPARRDGPYMRPARPCHVDLLFPRYMFAQFRRADDWQVIRDLPGVDYILGTAPDSPSPMPDDAIHRVRAVCEANDCQYPTGVDLHSLDAPVPFDCGAVVRWIGGPMVDYHGICEWSIDDRVGLLMTILGREVRMTAKRSMLEAV